MLDLVYQHNVQDIVGNLTDAEARHVPFVITLGLNWTAQDIRKELAKNLPKQFHIRNGRVEKGLRITPATRSRPEARVGTADWYMQDQEEGDTRRASDRYAGPAEAKGVWIPSLELRRGGVIQGLLTKKTLSQQKQVAAAAAKHDTAKRSRVGKRVRKGYYADRGDAAYKKPKPFIARMKTGKKGVFIRRDRKRTPIVLLYTVQDSVTVPPTWEFQAQGVRVTDKQYRRNFIKALDQAFKGNMEKDANGKRTKSSPLKSWYVENLMETEGAYTPSPAASRAGPLPSSFEPAGPSVSDLFAGTAGGGVIDSLRANAPG